MCNDDYLLASYYYDIPEEQIALYPSETRGGSRLLVMDKSEGTLTHSKFESLFDFFSQPVLFVVNNSKVLPARFSAHRKSGAVIEVLLLSPLPLLKIEYNETTASCVVDVLLKGAKRCTIGECLYTENSLVIYIEQKLEFGKYKVRFTWNVSESLESILLQHATLALPPYIKRTVKKEDNERYQTIFANDKQCGSIASATASLHCSEQFIEQMKAHGSSLAEVTLYVGYGTFSPIRSEDIREHKMHAEYISVDEKNATLIMNAKKNGIPIVAIGTTALRVCESIMARYGSIIPCSMMTDLYIMPPYQFQCIDALITNFHLAHSSLLVLVSAFASRNHILHAYKEAVERGYRFFSYGDAMLIL